MSRRIAASAVRSGAVLWERMPDLLIGLIDESSAVAPRPADPKVPSQGGPIVDLLYSAPPARCPALVGRARRWSAEPSKYPGVGPWLWRWLAYVVDQRAPGWRDAYGLFMGDQRLTSE